MSKYRETPHFSHDTPPQPKVTSYAEYVIKTLSALDDARADAALHVASLPLVPIATTRVKK